MKQCIKNSVALVILSIFFTSCATICGGSKYQAHVLVNGSPNAEIHYNGILIGNGSTTVSIPRKDANKVAFTIKDKGCVEQKFAYQSRTFRGWALVGSLFSWGYDAGGVPIFYGLIIDLADGAFWKPNISERGLAKHNYKNYQYTLNYTGCDTKTDGVVTPTNKSDMLVDVVYLKNGSVIRGNIIENDPSKQIKIQTADGSIFVFKVEEIEKITRE